MSWSADALEGGWLLAAMQIVTAGRRGCCAEGTFGQSLSLKRGGNVLVAFRALSF